ncbi:epoxide hydrolase family protein [Candidatus Binatus sp.]|uniref:epoxide hydrolase family protein n=1 Tax=Candidatus Binatus sp. TaxID=2811406 RepID=UPI003C826A59
MATGKIEPFRVEVPVEVLADLRARLSSARFPDEVPDTGWEYGTNLAYLKELIEYWRTRYDWRAQQRQINRFAQFKVNVDGLGIHFIHEKGKGPNPKPLLLIHGWPGSIYEFMELIPMLTDPAAHGGDAKDSLTVVAPSLPGYGFSDHPRARAMNIQAMAELFHKLMTETLGYQRYAVQGGDWGAAITSRIGEVHADSVFGIHINMIAIGPAEGRSAPELTPEEKVFLGDLEKFRTAETGYQWIQGTKPQTLAYGLNDSPAGLLAWIVEKFRTWSDCHGDVEKSFTRDQILTNVMIYWITQTINSSTRLYYEARHHPWRLKPGTRIEAPTAVALFPGELVRPPRRWAERAYNVRRWTVMPKGGHFAAMEEPELLAKDVREFFREMK